MLGEEVELLAEKLDVTPVAARRILVMREKWVELLKVEQGIVKLDPAKELDLRIMDVMGWWPGGLKEPAK